MIRLEKSEALGRKIRRDDVTELAISTWALVREAIQAGRVDEALEFIEYGCEQDRINNDSLVTSADDIFTHLGSFGDEEVEKVVRQRYYPRAKGNLSVTHRTAIDALQMCSEAQRRHYGNFTITEEPDRYVMKLDPCPTGGRLRRTRSVGTTKKAYPWSWSKSGVSYYCTHCCLFQEIIPIELRGYPICVTQYSDRPENPCVHLYYKKPELIPEEYFTRVGKTKTIK